MWSKKYWNTGGGGGGLKKGERDIVEATEHGSGGEEEG